jgi:hypothetical protein
MAALALARSPRSAGDVRTHAAGGQSIVRKSLLDQTGDYPTRGFRPAFTPRPGLYSPLMTERVQSTTEGPAR